MLGLLATVTAPAQGMPGPCLRLVTLPGTDPTRHTPFCSVTLCVLGGLQAPGGEGLVCVVVTDAPVLATGPVLEWMSESGRTW